jgi:hypothetical protein
MGIAMSDMSKAEQKLVARQLETAQEGVADLACDKLGKEISTYSVPLVLLFFQPL